MGPVVPSLMPVPTLCHVTMHQESPHEMLALTLDSPSPRTMNKPLLMSYPAGVYSKAAGSLLIMIPSGTVAYCLCWPMIEHPTPLCSMGKA